MVRRDGLDLRVSVLAGLLFLAASTVSLADPRRLVPGATTASVLEGLLSESVANAAAKLEESGCQRVFSDFRDERGQSLQQNLDALGHTGRSYLDLVLFFNGEGNPQCKESETVAYTSPGSRIVFLCSAQFQRKHRSKPGLAAALLIHEELHSLGLRENPPDSREITAAVISRCGQ